MHYVFLHACVQPLSYQAVIHAVICVVTGALTPLVAYLEVHLDYSLHPDEEYDDWYGETGSLLRSCSS